MCNFSLMFKPNKKVNKKFKKKDFFKKEKKNKSISYIVSENNENKNFKVFKDVLELKEIPLPKENEMFFIRTKRARPSTNLIPNNATGVYIFCSRIKTKYLNNNVQGILIQDKIYKSEKINETDLNAKSANNHTKMIIFKLNGISYVISGTGNPSINARIEMYVYEQNENLYNELKNFYKNV